MPLMLSCAQLEFAQDTDGDDLNRAMQELKVVVTHAGGGPYLILKTDRWAMDDPQELYDLLATVSAQVFPLFAAFNERETSESFDDKHSASSGSPP